MTIGDYFPINQSKAVKIEINHSHLENVLFYNRQSQSNRQSLVWLSLYENPVKYVRSPPLTWELSFVFANHVRVCMSIARLRAEFNLFDTCPS